MHRIVFLDRATLAPQITLRRPNFAHSWVDYPRTTPAELVARAQAASILVINKVPLRAETLAQLPNLKLIAVAATGTDCVDKAAARAAGIPVCNVRGYATAAVPEHCFALILALSRSLLAYRADVQTGAWQRAAQFCFFDHRIIDLAGRRLGVIGSGDLGARVAALGRAFGMEVVFAERKGAVQVRAGYVAFDRVLETADVLSLHCPLTENTRGLIGAAEFSRMKRRPILINTARGGLVDELALENALEQGLIAGAGLDVTQPEPPPTDSVIMRLAQRTNVIVTPHTAWASDEAQQRLADQVIENIEAFVAGSPRHLVTG